MSNHNPFAGKTLHTVGFKANHGVSDRTMQERVVKPFRTLAGKLPIVEYFICGKNNSPEGLSHGFEYFFILVFKDKKNRDLFLKDEQHHAFSASITSLVSKPGGVFVVDFRTR